MALQIPFFQKNEDANSLVESWIFDKNNAWQKIYFTSIIFVFIAMTTMSFSFGISGDELDMNAYGKAILQYFLSFGTDTTVFNMPIEFNRDGVIQYYGGFFDLVCAIVNSISPFNEFTTRHILNAWTGFLGMYFASQIALQLKNYQSAFLVVLLMFIAPFFLGHAMNNPKDIPFATAYIASIYLMIKTLDHIPKKIFNRNVLLLIISISLAINIRIGGLLLLGIWGLYCLLHYWTNRVEINLKKYIFLFFAVVFLSYLGGSLFWPFGQLNPILNPLEAMQKMGKFSVVIRQVFEGKRFISSHLPWYFLIKSFTISTPYIVLIGLFASPIFFVKSKSEREKNISYLIYFSILFPLLYIIFTKANVYHSWRHVLFIFPSVGILAAIGWQSIFSFFQLRKMITIALALFAFMLLEPIYFLMNAFPNYVCYFNGFVGGVRGAYGNYEMDYYYNGIKENCDWFVKNELPKRNPQDSIFIASNAQHIVAEYLKPFPNVKVNYVRFLERNQTDWDYSILHNELITIDFIQKNAWLPPKVLQETKVYGKTLSAVYARPSYHDVRAYNFLHEMKLDSALYYFQLYLEKDSLNTCILNATTKLLIQNNKMSEAARLASQSFQLDSHDPDTKLIYSITLIENKNFDQASKLLTEVTKEFPEDYETFFYLGVCEKNLNHLDEAISNFNIAANAEQFRPNALKMMGDIYMMKGMKTEAVKLYKAGGFMK